MVGMARHARIRTTATNCRIVPSMAATWTSLTRASPVPPEADIFLDWEERTVTFPDGATVELRSPKLRIENLNFGPLGADIMTSTRIAQPIFGLGLLEAVSEQTLLDIARKQDALGFNGRPNYVWDSINQRAALGRFGWKANQPSLKQQIVSAAIGDMGVASKFSPEQNCPPVQDVCARHLPGNDPELGTSEIDTLELWLHGLAVPARRNVNDPEVRRGAALFSSAQCAVCHVPELKTGKFQKLPQLSGPGFSRVHRPAAARHGRRTRRRPTRFRGRPARLAHAGAVGAGVIANGQRQQRDDA